MSHSFRTIDLILKVSNFLDERHELLAEPREPVLDPRRNLGKNDAVHNAETRELSKAFVEHLRGDAVAGTAHFTRSADTGNDGVKYRKRPLAADDALNHAADGEHRLSARFSTAALI